MENNGWISVEDKLPNVDETVLCWLGKYGKPSNVGYCDLAWYSDELWVNYDSDNIESDKFYVTHWIDNIPDRPYSKLELRKLKLENICSNQKK